MNMKKIWRRALLIPVLSLAAFLPAAVALAQHGGYGGWGMGPGMMGNWWGFGWSGGIFMIVFWVVVVLALILLIKWLVQSSGRNKTVDGGSDQALEILRERYARGEIDKEEFEVKKKDLTK